MTEQQLKQFGFLIREKRQELHLERDVIAVLLNVHPRTYAKWENGQSEPSLGQSLELAKILKTTLSDLVGESDTKVSNSFNNNTQEGESCVIENHIVSFDRETMQEINHRFTFLEKILLAEKEEKLALLTIFTQSKTGSP